ncbi:aspartate/glutamate racemase family protein [Actinomyces trachealis]|uniref:aspartate/glutamate racemase family protein n=1 Tax=Actinomyces trachealis TaxID=2763540 RepID=UPI001892900C|nr:amino acid racemase [Actinomyces trachealis]
MSVVESGSHERATGGVLGGLGPQATVAFLQMVIDNTVVQREQEHVDLIVSQRSSTPDRTAAILGRGPSPEPVMAADAKRLEVAGAQFIVIPCNTASRFLSAVSKAVSVPVLSIVEETVAAVRPQLPQARRIGLLATDGTIESGIYQDAATRHGLDLLVPGETGQRQVMSMIYDKVKLAVPVAKEEFFGAIDELRQASADVVIMGCTELSVLYDRFHVDSPHVLDSLTTLARRTVELGGGQLRTKGA